MTVGEGVFHGAYSFASRFEEGEGTNPEELIAAAHAACFSMALSNMLAGHGHPPESVRTSARVFLRNVDGAPTIQRIELETEGPFRESTMTTFRSTPRRPRPAARFPARWPA